MQKQDNPLYNFDIFNIISQYLLLKQKLALAIVNRQFSYLVNQHLNIYFNQNQLIKTNQRTQRQNLKYYFYRNLKVVKISTLFFNKQESTFYNFFKGKNIVSISSGKNFVAFVQKNNNAYFTKTPNITSKYNKQLKFQAISKVKKVLCQGQRMFVLKIDGTIQYYLPSQNYSNFYSSCERLDWSKRVIVQDLQVSYNFAIFILGKIKVSDIKRQILQQQFEQDLVIEQKKKKYIKIVALNLQNWKYTIIKYPFQQIRSYCVGHNIAYFVNQNNRLLQCELNNINEGQKDLIVSIYSPFQNKSIVRVESGLHFYIALARQQYVLDKWNNQRVLQWLRDNGLNDYINIMKVEKVDGKKLIEMDKKYMQNVLGITNTNLQQKILMSIEENNKISYKSDKIYGWGKNQTGQLGNSMANYFNKPIKIKLPELNKNQIIKDILCGWYNTIITTNMNRLFITLPEKRNQKQKQDVISDEQLKKQIDRQKKQIEKEKKGKNNNKKGSFQHEEKKQQKKQKKKNVQFKQQNRKVQKNRQKYQQQPQWIQFKSVKPFVLSSFKDTLVFMQLAYKQDEVKKKTRTAKAAVDKILWDPNIQKSNYKIGYFDKYMGNLEISVEQYQKSEIKQHRIIYLKKKQQIVWDRQNKIDIL